MAVFSQYWRNDVFMLCWQLFAFQKHFLKVFESFYNQLKVKRKNRPKKKSCWKSLIYFRRRRGGVSTFHFISFRFLTSRSVKKKAPKKLLSLKKDPQKWLLSLKKPLKKKDKVDFLNSVFQNSFSILSFAFL